MSSPKRTASASKHADDALLDSRIAANRIEKPKNLLFTVGLITAFLPAYGIHAILNLQWDALENAPLFLAIPLTTAFMLSQAYAEMYETEFNKNNPHYDETKSASDAHVLKQLRLQAALGWATFFANCLFIVLVIFFQMYMFRLIDPRVNFILSPSLSAALVWLIANKNEETRKKRLHRTK